MEESEENQIKQQLEDIKQMRKDLKEFERSRQSPKPHDDEKSPSEKTKPTGRKAGTKTTRPFPPSRKAEGKEPFIGPTLPEGYRNMRDTEKPAWLNARVVHKGQMVVKGKKDARQIHIDVVIRDPTNGTYHKTKALVDTGCEGVAIDRKWAEEQGLNTRKLKAPIKMLNADGTESKGGKATHYFQGRMKLGQHIETIDAVITDLEKETP